MHKFAVSTVPSDDYSPFPVLFILALELRDNARGENLQVPYK